MHRAHSCLVLTYWLILFAAPLRADERAVQRVAELEKEVTRLKAELNRLADQLEGAGKPVNLGRTSLAAVRASSVNGGRTLACKYYGIRNAFDDGNNWLNSINYTWWLASGASPQWVEIQFDTPVTVTMIHVEAKAPFATQLFWSRGGEENHAAVTGRLDLKQPAVGVKRIRLSFPDRGTVPANLLDGGNVRVDEIRVLGYVPAGTKYEVGTPRLWLTHADLLLVAQDEFRQWAANLLTLTTPVLVEEDQRTVVTFLHRDTRQELFRVIVMKGRHQITVEPLVLTTPRRDK